MTNTKNAIKNLEDWFGNNHKENLVDAIRWLLFNNPSLDNNELTNWLIEHNEEVCPPKNCYAHMTNTISNIDEKTIVENIFKINKE